MESSSSNSDFNQGDARHPLTDGQPQHHTAISLTFTCPAPGVGGGGSAQPGSSAGSLIVSGSSSAGGQMHYSGESMSSTPIQENIQSEKNYVMSGGGQSLTVSGGNTMPGLSMGTGSGHHHDDRCATYGCPYEQSNLCSKATPSQSYVMSGASIQSGSAGGGGGARHDSGDEDYSNSTDHDLEPSSSNMHRSGQTEGVRVEGALNYLDQVKYTFRNQPEVYNEFLSTIKNFKNLIIDTPEVISRVSNLFHGHPDLIGGFHAFLPPESKIGVQVHDQESQEDVDGVTSYVVTDMLTIPPPPAPMQQVFPPGVGCGNSPPEIMQHTARVPLMSAIPVVHSGVPAAYGVPSFAPPQIGWSAVSPPPSAAVTLTPIKFEDVVEPFPAPFGQNAFSSLQSHQPAQYIKAINYVNKIKNRFYRQPDKYQRFRDVLQSYQKEQRNTEGIPGKNRSEHGVYSQVAKIFENQEDLLQEFGQFLPECNNQSASVSCSLTDYGLQQRQQLSTNKKATKVAPRDYGAPLTQPSTSSAAQSGHGKRASTAAAHPVRKKPKCAANEDIWVADSSSSWDLQFYGS